MGVSEPEWLEALGSHYRAIVGVDAPLLTVQAWRDRFSVLRGGLPEALSRLPQTKDWEVFFQIDSRPECGRGPDAVIRAGDYLIVLAFAAASQPAQAHLDRIMACARDLRRHHPASRSLSAVPVLVLMATNLRPVLHDGVCVMDPGKFHGLFLMLGLGTTNPAPDAAGWLATGTTTHNPSRHAGPDFETWATRVLAGQLTSARQLGAQTRDQGFDLYLTRSQEAAAAYVCARYDGHDDVDLDFPVVNWTGDLIWDGERWVSGPSARTGLPANAEHGPDEADLFDSYRAQMTRGRDRMSVVVPGIPSLDSTYEALASAGLMPLAVGVASTCLPG